MLLLTVMLVGLGLSAPLSGRASPGEVLALQRDGVPLYEAPRSSAPVLRVLNREHRLLEFRRKAGWVKVAVFRMVGGRGWIRSAEVTPESAIQEPLSAKPAPRDNGIGEHVVQRFVLDIDGTPAIAFRASCRVTDHAGTQRKFEFAGSVPDRAVAEGRAVSCVVRKTDSFGRLKVILLVGEDLLAAAETRAPFNWVRVRSHGPWGPAQAVRGSVALVIPKATTPLRRDRTIIPPMGNPVPALRPR